MAKKRSDNSKFQSRYSPGSWCTPAQYIVELVCEQAAKYTNTDLPLRFWKQDKWESFFKSQTRASNRLIKKYNHQVIIAVIKKKKIRSLIPKWVEGVIQKEQKLYNAEKERAKREKPEAKKPETNSIITKEKTRTKRFSSSIDKLLDIDGEI